MDLDTKLWIVLFMSMAFDWIFQTRSQASLKFCNWIKRAEHSLIYAAITSIWVSLFGYPYWMCLWIAGVLLVTHFIIDDRCLVRWVMVGVKGIPEEELPGAWWLGIAIDQWLHLLVNTAIAVAACYVW